MDYRRLGSSGLKLSAFSFGSWITFDHQLDISKASECMKLAYDSGINFFDNAEVYANGESEVIMGKVIKKLRWSRDSFCVSSKVFWGGALPTQSGLHRKHVFDACHAALKRLQVDYLDLYFCHRPDETTPIEETVSAMDTLIRQGKVLYWGTSEWSAQQVTEAYGWARRNMMAPPTMEQPQYNMFHRDRVEREYRRLYTEIGLGTTVWSPLASGVLTGKYVKSIPAGSRLSMPKYAFLRRELESDLGKWRLKKVEELAKIAKELDAKLSQLALAWCLKNPYVSSVILGASKPSQLAENLGALKILPHLTEEVMTKIDKVLGNRP